MNDQINTRNFFDIMIRLAFLALIVSWCILILFPFTSILLWGLILALALNPLKISLARAIGGRDKLAALIILLAGLVVLILPSWIFMDSLIDWTRGIKESFDAGKLTIAPPTEEVKSWPLIGKPLFDLWMGASVSLEQTLVQHKETVMEYGGKMIKGLMGIGGAVLQMVISLIIAAVLIVTPGVTEALRKFFRKAAGDKGDEFAEITYRTVGNVVKGILGVAFIQSFFIGIGFVFAGVPFAGVWTLLIFVMAILQLPPPIVVIPVIIYLFSNLGTTPAILWSVYLAAGAFSDNILKPILLGKGAPVPMLVIFLGVIGGFMLSGFIGLFTGAIIVSIGYKLLVAWINDQPHHAPDIAPASTPAPGKELVEE